MTCDRILGGDSLFRHSLHPVSFRGRAKIFAQDKLFTLYQEDAQTISASLVWEQFASSADQVHEYGCRLASRRNLRKQEEGKFKDKDRQIYCGAYEIKARAIRALSNTEGLDEIATADVIHDVEDGEIAHASVKISLKDGDFNVESTRTAIVDRLWNASKGPLLHVCECDQNIDQHPNTGLVAPPNGAYVVRRRTLQFFYEMRFWICNWLGRRDRKIDS